MTSISREERVALRKKARRILQKHAQSPLDQVMHMCCEDALDAVEEALRTTLVANVDAHIAALEPNERLIEALERLEAAGTCVFDGLNARIDAACDAGGKSVPVFAGIADLSDALNETRELLSTTKADQ